MHSMSIININDPTSTVILKSNNYTLAVPASVLMRLVQEKLPQTTPHASIRRQEVVSWNLPGLDKQESPSIAHPGQEIPSRPSSRARSSSIELELDYGPFYDLDTKLESPVSQNIMLGKMPLIELVRSTSGSSPRGMQLLETATPHKS